MLPAVLRRRRGGGCRCFAVARLSSRQKLLPELGVHVIGRVDPRRRAAPPLLVDRSRHLRVLAHRCITAGGTQPLPARTGSTKISNEEMQRIQGQLLIAGGGLFDPNFRQTVVLVVEHGPEGALGVVLNRPSTVTVEEAAPALSGAATPGELLYLGGPVQPQAAVILAQFEHPDMASQLVFDSVGVVGDDGEGLDSEGLIRKRIFAGYAGWAAGQLDAELDSGDWIPEPAHPNDIFTDRPEELWSLVLKRKGGDYSLLAHMPFDPSTN